MALMAMKNVRFHLPALLLVILHCWLPAIGQCGSIQGIVTEKGSGNPIDNLRIRVYDTDWQIRLSACTWTESDGSYSTGELVSGSYYIRAVSNYPQPWVTQYWFASSERATAIPVQVASGEPILGIDFSLEKGGYISGAILDNAGYPLVDLDLDLYTSDWVFDTRYSALTDSDGIYVLGPIPPGSWYLRADPDAYHGVCQQYWPMAWYREEAVILALEAGIELPGVDFQLAPGGAVQGNVFESRNLLPKPDCDVSVYSLEGVKQPIHSAISNQNGLYLAYGLPPGSYYVQAEPVKGCGAAAAFYSTTSDPTDAHPVDVMTLNTTSGMDIYLPEGNFSLSSKLVMPDRNLSPGDVFSLTMTTTNKGPLLENIPVFIILDLHGDMYFWPSWARWAPPEHTGVDYAPTNVPPDSGSIDIFPEIAWPEVTFAMTDLQFIGALTNWSITDLASDVTTVEWSFSP